MRVFIRVQLQKQPFRTVVCRIKDGRMASASSIVAVADDHHASLPHTRCLIDALRLRTSEMGCSRYMALVSTCQDACPR